MKILQNTSEIIFFAFAIINVGIWIHGGFRLPRYIHYLALAAFCLGGITSYEIFTLGVSAISALWIPFLFVGIVYIVFVLHGGGVISKADIKKPGVDK